MSYSKKILCLTLLSAFLISCATPYQANSEARNTAYELIPFVSMAPATGGYTSTRVSSDLIKVSFQGQNESPATVSAYTLRRVAEIGQQTKHPYFALYSSIPDAAANRKTQTIIAIPGVNFKLPTIASIYAQYHQNKQVGDFSVAQVLK